MIDFQRHAAFDVGRIRTMYRPGCSFKKILTSFPNSRDTDMKSGLVLAEHTCWTE